jgi:hypothetical protein
MKKEHQDKNKICKIIYFAIMWRSKSDCIYETFAGRYANIFFIRFRPSEATSNGLRFQYS